MMNLLGNAMKWTTAGFIEIALSKARDHRIAEKVHHDSSPGTCKGPNHLSVRLIDSDDNGEFLTPCGGRNCRHIIHLPAST
jgi:signal transduction histidine kinase